MLGNPRSRWSARRLAMLGGAGGAGGAVSLGQALSMGQRIDSRFALTAAIALSFTGMGALVLTAVPGHRMGWLMVAAGTCSTAQALAMSWADWLPLAWLSQWLWWPPFGPIVLSLLMFPDGRLPSRRWRPVAGVIVAATAVGTLALAAAAIDAPRTLISAAEDAPTARALLLAQIAVLAIAVTFLGLVLVLGSLWVRWRRADEETRPLLICVLPAGMLILVGVALDVFGFRGAWLITAVAVPAGMTVAVLRYRLYDIDQIVNRTIVWLVMSLLVILGFVGIVAVLRQLVTRSDTSSSSLVATGVIAVMFEPLRRRVQRGVDKFLYGDRDDPYQVIARIGDPLGRTVDPTAVLPQLVGTIARSLRVPYVAIELDDPGGPRVLAEHGRAGAPVETFDLLVHGEAIGRLVVAARHAGGRFSRRERRLLTDVAVHAAGTVEATRLVRDLQESRGRLVLAREEERRRLRRELHDGLGPALAGMTMQVRAAHKLVAGQPQPEQILRALADDLRDCTKETRVLVDQLRPAALDGGLAAALWAECRRFDPATLSVELAVDDDLDGLPAAIEVAAYRIVAEALTNVARHAKARHCWVTVSRARSLTVEVVDDGVGVGDADPEGIGLASMRERAIELGGECVISRMEPRGTAVRVRLPFLPTARAEIGTA